MPYVVLIVVVLGVALLWWMFRRPAPAAPRPLPIPADAMGTPVRRSSTAAQPAAAGAAMRPLQPSLEPLPAELANFAWITESTLDADRRETLLTAIRGIPRPPRSMQQLLSPEFLAKASSADLSELIMSEPLIAAKVLSTVNSPMYGLKTPVTSIGQGVTFLGINTVRSICMQYMLAEAFKPKLAEAQQAFDRLWRASAIASELAVRLGKALQLPDQGSLSTQVVLGFVGQLATASLIPAAGLGQWLGRDRLLRAGLEQDLLGLNASEIGAVLMKSWELPDSRRCGRQRPPAGDAAAHPAGRPPAAPGPGLPVHAPGRAPGAAPDERARRLPAHRRHRGRHALPARRAGPPGPGPAGRSPAGTRTAGRRAPDAQPHRRLNATAGRTIAAFARRGAPV